MPSAIPSLNELLVGFVNRPVDAETIAAQTGAFGEVEPHEVAVGFRVEPHHAWREGVAVMEVLGQPTPKIPAPSEWAAVVVRHDSIAAQPFALANYPQRVRDLSTLLQAKDLAAFRIKPEARPASASLRGWAEKQSATGDPAKCLLAAAVLRAAQDFDAASAILDRTQAPSTLDSCARNERAAMFWQIGEWEKAATIWNALPESVAVLFNRGLAALFLNQSATARECLKKAIEKLPETSGWHHLASLYLALAEIRK